MNESYEDFRQKKLEFKRLENINLFWLEINKDKINKNVLEKINKKYIKYKNILNENNIKNLEDYILYLKKSKLHILNLEIEPTRQNFDENLQIEYYNHKTLSFVKKLPGSGKNSVCFDKNNSKLCSTLDIKHGLKNRTKTFDAIYNDILFIFKHIEEPGGAQDNQFLDVLEQIKYCVQYNKLYEKKYFKVILSGKYAENQIFKIKEFNDNYINILLL